MSVKRESTVLEWDRNFSGFGRSENSGRQGFKMGRFFYFIKVNQCVNSFPDDLVKMLYK